MRKAVHSSDIRVLAASAVVLTVLLCFAWRRLIVQGRVPVDGNVIAVGYPNWELSRTLWRRPRLPLWNPRRNMGIPHLADPITSAGYPLLWMLSAQSRFVDFMRSWVVLHTLIAGFFMGALVWRWRRDLPASVASGIIAGLNGFFVEHVVFPHVFASQAWLPAVLYFQYARSWVGLGVCFALQWLAGYPSFSLLSVAAVFCIAAATGREGIRCFLKGGAFALGLAAFQLLPFLELLAHSARGVVLDPMTAAQFSVPWHQLLKMLLLPQWGALSPYLEGDPAIMGLYVGPLVLGAAVYALRGGRPRETVLAAGAVLCLLFSLGRGLPGYRHLFFLHFFRFPPHWYLLATTALAVLCASGIARLRSPRLKWALVAGIALDLALFAQYERAAWSRPDFLSEAPALVQAARTLKRPVRIYHSERLMRAWEGGTLETEEDYLLMRDFLAPSYGMAFGLQDTINFQTMRLKRGEAYRRRLASAPRGSPLFDWAGIGMVVDLERGARRVERGSIRLRFNRSAKRRVFIPDAQDGRLELLDYQAGSVSAAVDFPKPGSIVFSEVLYPGWKAFVDGKPVRVGRFEDIFIRVDVPAGRHEVRFLFSPASFWLGLAVSLLAIGFLIAAKFKKDFLKWMGSRRWTGRPKDSLLQGL